MLTQVPIASAHGANATGGLSQDHGLILVLVGAAILGGFILLKRIGRITPTAALYGVFVGITVTALGAVLFEGLSPDPTYTASSMPFPRSWYQPLALLSGLGIMVASFVVGWLRWPSRPRYTFLGILMGLWISYPYLIPGHASDTHPLGYAIVLGTPILVGYVVWKDAGSVIRAVMRDPVARRFGIGVGVVLALFFISVTGYLSFFPEEGFPHEVTVVVLPAIYQLVTWPTLEIAIPHIPFFLALSPGQVIIVGMLSGLIGLNAALIARHWRVEERAGMTEGTAGSAAIVGTCTCGCCGPLVAKIAVLAAGPSIAAPLYWVFVDSASPLSALFIVGSLLLFTGSLLYSIKSARSPNQSTSIVPAD
ncbi:hypothetical protein [Halorussus aquaticus]|uniref:Uncharacterized protein n=1 Tax=Halorussus aquaticus TaxID=2953748 RepID=A0ABD5Q7Q7_9EURY|nr:hypothetical protein [Halorussus aquaticus]